MHPTQIILRPVITEKVTILRDNVKKVAFFIHPQSNKIEVKKAIELLFNVKVMAINVVNYAPRVRTRNRRKIHVSGCRKAYVTLAPGEKISFFEGL